MTRILPLVALSLSALALGSTPAFGQIVKVTVTGKVEYNQINPPPLGNVAADDPASLSFLIDASVFVDSPNFPTRGYPIDEASFLLNMGSTSMGLQNPFPAGATPYFVIRDNDPAVDGFFVATSIDFPIGVPINQNGAFGQFIENFSVTYGGGLLPSLDVLDALGTYDFTGLQVFHWAVDDGPFNPLGKIFGTLTIELPSGPTVYCQGKLNSQGCTPSLSTDAGFPSVSGGPWNVHGTDLINNKPGIFFYGFGANNVPFQGGTLCVAPPVTRTGLLNSGGNPPPDDCSGTMSIDVTAMLPLHEVPSTVFLQIWARDVAASFGSGLSNAVEVTVCP